MELKYAKRSVLNTMLTAIKGKTYRAMEAWLVFNLKPKIPEDKLEPCSDLLYAYRRGDVDQWDAGTAFANLLGYNVIQEDTLNVD